MPAYTFVTTINTTITLVQRWSSVEDAGPALIQRFRCWATPFLILVMSSLLTAIVAYLNFHYHDIKNVFVVLLYFYALDLKFKTTVRYLEWIDM